MENVKSNVIICSVCGCPIHETEKVEADLKTGEPMCEHCYLEHFSFCACCDEPHAIEDMEYIDGYGYVCQDCIDEVCFQCDDCGEYVVNDEHNQVTGERGEVRHVCDNCLENSYFWCDGCGSYHPESEMHWDSDVDCYYCEECYEEHRDDYLVMGYHDFNDWELHYVDSKNEGIMKGFELEIENADTRDDARTVNSYMDGFVVMEEDGSLDNGFEIISHPFTTEYFNTYRGKSFEKMLKALYENGCTSGENDSGLHIHVSRECLTYNTTLSEDEVIDNIIMIMESFRNELMKFSRRTEKKMEKWAAFISTQKSDFELSYKWIKANKCGDRYQALNLTNSKTIEFRIFNGTLNFRDFMASIELVDNIVEIARKGNIDGLTWDDIVTHGGVYIADYVNDYRIFSDAVLHIVESSDEKYGKLKGGVKGKIAYLNDCVEEVVLAIGRNLRGDYLVYNPEIKGHSGSSLVGGMYTGTIAQDHLWWINPAKITLTDIDAYPVYSNEFNRIGFKICDDNSGGANNLVYLGSDFEGHSGGSVDCEFVNGTPMEKHCWWFYDYELKKFN